MTVVKLAICIIGIYASFLSWALFQERLTTTPYTDPTKWGGDPRYFRSAVFLNTIQSAFSALAALLYLYIRGGSKRRRTRFLDVVGIDERYGKVAVLPKAGNSNGSATNGYHPTSGKEDRPQRNSAGGLVFRCLQCALLQSFGSPLGFASVRHLDYPTVLLGKACKLVPVMLMNVVLYRRRFALHKYIVVALVTAGLALFMLCGDEPVKRRGKGGAERSSVWGLVLLTANLISDGAVNSTQDEIFARYTIDGSQLMFLMNTLSTAITVLALVVPNPSFLSTSPSASELRTALDFISHHPAVLRHIVAYSLAGALGQLFIFETLASFGSLTLVTITVTRKLATMALSVVVFDHRLTPGQWAGVAIVFGAVGLEAYVKMGHGRAKKVIEEKVRPRVKEL